MTLQFGVWDSFERLSGVSATVQYAERIELVGEAERLGFYGYHLAEHHLSPLSMAPSPLLFLSAVSQRTSTIRIGSMVTILPLYPPVRLVQEICMLDALSNGRLELGVGRGIRDAEHEWFGHDPTTTHAKFAELLERIRSALMDGKIEVDAPTGTTDYVPLVHEPTQQPTPRFWYVGNMEFAAEQGMSVLARRPTRQEVEAFWSNWQAKVASGSPLHAGHEPLIGATRPTFVARTDEDAERVAVRAWEVLGEHFWATETRSGGGSLPRGASAGSFGGGDVHHAFDNGDIVFGSPERVAGILSDFLAAAGPGFNYLVSSFQWGDLSHEEAKESMGLFARERLPLGFVSVTGFSAEPAEAGWTGAPGVRARSMTFRTEHYEKVGEHRLSLDIFQQTGTSRSTAVLVLHGGAWRAGSRQAVHTRAEALARHGVTAVAVEYRLLGEAAWPSALTDVQAAIDWVHAHEDELGIVPGRIVLQGHSSGAHLALLAAAARIDSDVPIAAVVALYPTIGFHLALLPRTKLDSGLPDMTQDADGTVASHLLLDEETDAEVIRSASPIEQVRSGFPPTLILHGGSDQLVRPLSSMVIYEKMKGLDIVADLHVFAGQNHEFDRAPRFLEMVVREVVFFLDRYVCDVEAIRGEGRALAPFPSD